jgi:hypothetical protein
MKATITILILIILIALGALAYFFFGTTPTNSPENQGGEAMEEEAQVMNEDVTPVDDRKTMLGKSAGGRDIIAYHYGSGSDHEVIVVGGIHGGYSPNTALVAYEFMDYFEANSAVIPAGVKVTVVPALNPDGLFALTGKEGRIEASDVTKNSTEGRFNGNGVDLNRNFDCDWQQKGTWQSKEVDGGTAAFSEPESAAIRNYVDTHDPDSVVVFYSAVGGVFSSNCHNGVLGETKTLTNLYADASGYLAHEEFNFYEITGDMTNWLAKRGTPAISVLLTDHLTSEWEKNRKGLEAVLKHYKADDAAVQ